MTGLVRLRVTRVRSQNPLGHGGAIFTGVQIDRWGNVEDASSYLVVRASGGVLAGVRVEPGQWWEVEGGLSSRALELNGYRMMERQVEAAQATLIRPSGEHIVTLLSDNPAFEGIGRVKARKLWEAFGEGLYQILDEADVGRLSTLLTPDTASQAVQAWAMYGDARTLKWLQAHGFDVTLGRKVVQFFGSETAMRIEQDPYRLLSFCASWKVVDALARIEFGVAVDDPRRLQGAIEEACYRQFTAGHTLVPRPALIAAVGQILRAPGHDVSVLICQALEQGLNNGSYVVRPEGLQPLGALAMETVVARVLAMRIQPRDSDALMSADAVDRLIADHETAEGFILNAGQRAAIQRATLCAFACITGGAGVGKTTVLKALYRVYDHASIRVIQLALAGRAARRMQEATGRKASTIAGFLQTYSDDKLAMPCVLVVDEASMVDVITMSRLCEVIPSHARLLLVGDPHQLMPVGPGLVLHAVVTVADVPVSELTVVKRYGDEIRDVASSIRRGVWPMLASDDSAAVVFLPCAIDESSISDLVVNLYLQEPENTQILSSRRNGSGGTRALNAACQSCITRQRKELLIWNESLECREHTGLYLGDIVLCTRNLWEEGIQNGSLGTIVIIYDEPCSIIDEKGRRIDGVVAWVEWDDSVRRPLNEHMLDDIDLGYAVTVHKAQGSQWPRVIIPVTSSRLLDRTLLYTAITRAQRQVVLVGDEHAARSAASRTPRAQMRQVALGSTIKSMVMATA